MHGAEFVFSQDADGVTAHVVNAAGEKQTVRGRYIVSCEGARSIVRKELDIEFEGFTYSDRTLNIEVAYDFKRHGYTDRNYISDPVEWSNLFHWKGPPERWRVHFPTKPEEDPDALTRAEAMQARLQGFLSTGKPFEIVGCNLYTVHQRVAEKFRKGRAIPAGDSAHVNSSDRRYGLNSGVTTRSIFADKLKRIWRGETRRCSISMSGSGAISPCSTQQQTIRNKKPLMEKDPAVRQKNHDELKPAGGGSRSSRACSLRTSLIESVREAARIA